MKISLVLVGPLASRPTRGFVPFHVVFLSFSGLTNSTKRIVAYMLVRASSSRGETGRSSLPRGLSPLSPFRRIRRVCVAPCRADQRSSGLIVEMDSVITDIHVDGHRTAFNEAFKEFSLECAVWSGPVYNDLRVRLTFNKASHLSPHIPSR